MKTKRRKKYNKKVLKNFKKKSFRKQSYKKKTLRKTFNKKKFRNLKGGTWLQYSPDGTGWLQYSPYRTGWSRIDPPIYHPRYNLGRNEYGLSMPRQNLNRSYVDEITTLQNAERGRHWLNLAIASRDNDRRKQKADRAGGSTAGVASRQQEMQQMQESRCAASGGRREEVASNWGRKNVLSSAQESPFREQKIF